MVKIYNILVENQDRAAILSKDKLVDFFDLVQHARQSNARIPAAVNSVNEILEQFGEWELHFPFLKSYAESNSASLIHYDLAKTKIRPPVPKPRKIMVMAGNAGVLRNSLKERKRIYPEWVFKAPSAIVGHDDAVELPPSGFNNITIPELELGVIVGKRARWVDRKDAYSVVAGYTIFNDVTASDLIRGKMASISPEEYDKIDLEEFHTPPSFNRIEMKCWDTFAPMGPCIVTKDEIPDPHKLSSTMTVNGRKVGHSDNVDLLWDVPEMIHKFSMIMTIEPCDIFSTSSICHIIGKGRSELLLKPGYVMELTVPEIGTLRNHIVASKYPPEW